VAGHWMAPRVVRRGSGGLRPAHNHSVAGSAHAVGSPALIVSIHALMFAIWI